MSQLTFLAYMTLSICLTYFLKQLFYKFRFYIGLGFFFFFLFFFLVPQLRHMEVPRLGVKLELQLPAYTTATATQDLRPIYTTAQGNTRSLTHWARPGIKPATSWFLIRFISPAPRGELQHRAIYPEFCDYLWGKRIWERMDMCMCVAGSLCCTAAIITTL